jgi:CDP-diacylglycerol--serine O-phosphatidyltransferase
MAMAPHRTEQNAGNAALESSRKHRRLVPKPAWVGRLERKIAHRIPFHPNLISAAKLLFVAPGLLLSLRQVRAIPGGWVLVTLLCAAFATLDYLDGVVARERGLATKFGRVFDRLTDYPLLIGLSYFCVDVIPLSLLALKLGLDLLLLLLYVLGRGSTENRLRTAISYTTLFSLLALSQGWLPQLFQPTTVSFLLFGNIAFSLMVGLYNLDVVKKRYIADLLSLGNLGCGVLAMVAASRGRFELSLVLLVLGAGFDGVDGAAARRWGSTRWGVYSDDIADGVNFGLAPGVVVFFGLGGVDGAVIGGLFALFTIGRLVFFTLNKGEADPRYFNGVPSPVGGLVATCSIILFAQYPALVGLLVGAACALMVSFATLHRHLGRLLASHRRLLLAVPLVILGLLLAGIIFGARGPAALVLAAALTYGLWPVARAFATAARDFTAQRQAPPHPS